MAGTMVKRVLMQLSAEDMDAEAKLDLLMAKAKELSEMHPELKPKIDSSLALAQARVIREELKAALKPPAADEVQQEWGSVLQQGIRPEIEKLQAAIGKLQQRAADTKFKGDDKQLLLTIDKLKLKLQELQEKARPEMELRGAERAMLEVRALELEFDGLERKYAKRGLLSRILTGGTGGGGLAGILGNIPGIGGKIQSGLGGDAAAAGESGPPQLTGVLLGGVLAALPALVTEADALASGFAAAGAGAGAFYLLAHPALANLKNDYTNLQTAQAAYNLAQEKAAASPTKANLKAEADALLKLQVIRRGMTKDEGSAADGISRLSAEYHKLTTAFTPEAFKVFNGMLQIANNILPQVTPFAKTFADSFSGLLGEVAKATAIPGRLGNARLPHNLDPFDKMRANPPPTAWETFLKQFQALEGPSITAIGVGVGHLVTNFGKLLTILSAKGVVNGINIAFSILDGTLIGLIATIRFTVQAWDRGSAAWRKAEAEGRRAGHDIAASFDLVRHAAAQLGHDVAVRFDRIRHDIAQWAGDVRHDTGLVVSFFGGLPGRIGAALAALPGELFSLGQHAVSMFVAGLKSVPVVGTVVGWAQDIWDHLPHSPAKKGPLSGSGSPDIAGRRVGQMFAAGMRVSVPDVSRAAAGLAQAATVHASGHGGGSAAGPGRVVIEIRGDAALRQWLKKSIRVTGGDVTVVGA